MSCKESMFLYSVLLYQAKTKRRCFSNYNCTVEPPIFQWRHRWFFTVNKRCTRWMAWFGLVTFPFTRMYSVEQNSKICAVFDFFRTQIGQIHPIESEKHRDLSGENQKSQRKSQKTELELSDETFPVVRKPQQWLLGRLSSPVFSRNLSPSSIIVTPTVAKNLQNSDSYKNLGKNSLSGDEKWKQDRRIQFWTDPR